MRPRVYREPTSLEVERRLLDIDALTDARTLLDVGCGIELPFDVPRHIHLVGLDISPQAVASNQNIDEGLVADVERTLPVGSFDLVLCWNLLEHLRRPEAAVRNLVECVSPGGILVIALPRRSSAKGLVTWVTPHWFHVAVRRHIFRQLAADETIGPFKTYFRISPNRVVDLCREFGLEVLYFGLHRGASQDELPRLLRLQWQLLLALLRLVSLGRAHPELSESVVIVRHRKDERAAAQPAIESALPSHAGCS